MQPVIAINKTARILFNRKLTYRATNKNSVFKYYVLLISCALVVREGAIFIVCLLLRTLDLTNEV